MQATPGAIWWQGSLVKENASRAAQQKEQSLLALVQEEGPASQDGHTQDPAENPRAKRYAAALALWRLKKLRLEQVIPTQEGETLRFRLVGTQKRFEVAHPGLSEDRLRNMEEDLLRMAPGGYAAPFQKAA